MCPKCVPQYFPKKRTGQTHISPRFNCCNRWAVYLDDKRVSNAYEATAGTQGVLWYSNDEACDCGSGIKDLGMAAGVVELYHEAHPTKVNFDDGSNVTVTCPEMHMGPYNKHKPPIPPFEEAEALGWAMMESARKILIGVQEEKAKFFGIPTDDPASGLPPAGGGEAPAGSAEAPGLPQGSD